MPISGAVGNSFRPDMAAFAFVMRARTYLRSALRSIEMRNATAKSRKHKEKGPFNV
jgi:hypothetical protein